MFGYICESNIRMIFRDVGSSYNDLLFGPAPRPKKLFGVDPAHTHGINNLWELVSMPLILLKYCSTKQGVPDTSSHNRSHLLIEMYSFFSPSVRCLPLIGCDSPFSAAVAIAHPPLLHSSMSPLCPAVFLSSILSSSLSLSLRYRRSQ